ncbi:MAG: hypothetical protein AAGA35_04055 [Patescibacteria group bacterium]
MPPKFKPKDTAAFTNKSLTGFTGNDGTIVTIVAYTGDDLAELAGEPCYQVEGLPHAVRESELQLIETEGEDDETC